MVTCPSVSAGIDANIRVAKSHQGKRFVLEFDGVYRDSDFWLNGQHIGHWTSGYIPARFDVTEILKHGGNNTLAVRCNASLREGWWYEGCGIYRTARLHITDDAFIAPDGVFAETTDLTPDTARIRVRTSVTNRGADTSLIVATTIRDLTGDIVASARSKPRDVRRDQEDEWSEDLTIKKPTLWSPENPALYSVESRLVRKHDEVEIDKATVNIGLRTFHFDPEIGFHLNGKHYRLNGVCNHDSLGPLGTALPTRVRYEAIRFLKDAGGVFFRGAHNPRSSEELDACDRFGILVANETRYFDESEFGRQSLRTMVRRDRNHPSVILWSLGNEGVKVQGTPAGMQIARTLMKDLRGLDSQRPISIAQNGKFNDPCGFSDMFDVLGLNWRGAEDAADDHRKFPKRAVYVSEYNYGGQTWDSFVQYPWIAGSSTWTGFDYRGEDNFPNTHWPGHLGDCLHYPTEKFHLARCQWGEHDVLWVDNRWTGKAGDNVSLKGYTTCDRVDVFIGGRRVNTMIQRELPNRKPFLSEDDCRLSIDLPFQPNVSLRLVGICDGRKVAEQVLKPVGLARRLVLEPSSPVLRSDGRDVAIIKVSVVDQDTSVPVGKALYEHGNVVKDSPARRIKLKVDGPGELIATGNAARNINELGVRSSLAKGDPWTYHGVCQAIVRSTGEPGTITVTATTDGLISGKVSVQARPDVDPFDAPVAKLMPAAEQLVTRRVSEGNGRSNSSPDPSLTRRVTKSSTNENEATQPAFQILSVQLPDENVKADVSVSARIQARNISSFYPLEVEMRLSGRAPSVERFSIPLGETRDIVVAGPRLYRTGRHDISIAFSRNGKVFHKVSHTINVAETPAAFFVDSSAIPKSVLPNERLTIRAAVRNTGSVPSRELTIPLSVNGKAQPTTAPELPPGETRELDFAIAIPASGTSHHLKIGQFESNLKVVRPPVSAAAFDFYGSPRQTGDANGKAIQFDGANDFAELKTPINLKNKAFTICLWFRLQDPESIQRKTEPILVSGRKGGLRAGINTQNDPFFAFATNLHWRHPKPKPAEWTFHCYQLQAKYLPRQTGGADDGSLDVQKATWETAMRIYVNGKRDHAKKLKDNTFHIGEFSAIAGSVNGDRFKGEIGDLKVYLRDLSIDEVRQLYEESHTEKLPAVRDDLVLWSTFDDKSYASIKAQQFVLKEIDENPYPKERRVYLKLKDAISAKQGWSTPKQDKSVQNNPIRIAGTTYERGIGTHSPGQIIYDLTNSAFERFYARVGVDDESAGTLGYEVYLDDKLVFESGPMSRGDEAKTVDVKLANARRLKLIVTTGADNRNDGDHADWADACLIRAEQ